MSPKDREKFDKDLKVINEVILDDKKLSER